MNRARVAALLRELADEIERDGDAVPAAPKSKPRKTKPRRRAPSYPAPLRPASERGVSEIAVKRAENMLRRRGLG